MRVCYCLDVSDMNELLQFIVDLQQDFTVFYNNCRMLVNIHPSHLTVSVSLTIAAGNCNLKQRYNELL